MRGHQIVAEFHVYNPVHCLLQVKHLCTLHNNYTRNTAESIMVNILKNIYKKRLKEKWEKLKNTS